MKTIIFKNLLVTILIFLSLFFFGFKIWLTRYFGKVDFDLLLININFGLNGLLDTDEILIQKFFLICVLIPFFLTTISYFLLIRNRKSKLITIISPLVLILSIVYFLTEINFTKSTYYGEQSSFIEDNYIIPELKELNFKNKKSLILIYLESFEKDYLLNKNLDDSIISEINFDKNLSIDTPNFYETKFNDYTIGAIVSSHCGIPQKPVGIFNVRTNIKKDKDKKNYKEIFGMKKFLPNAICLGDILKHHGYKNIFINSGDLNFQEMNKFFLQHGYDTLIGKSFFAEKKIPKKSWSKNVNDSTLLNEAKKIIEKHINNDELFNITILTTDTHYPGFVDPNCQYKDIDDKQIYLSIYCTAKSVSDFIEQTFIKYPKKISIVVIGDHLNPKNQLNNNLDRFIFGKIFSDDTDKIERNRMTHYDLFPTILQLINLNYGNSLGLGKSFLDEKENSKYNMFFNTLKKDIGKKSEFYNEFWK